MFQVNVRSSILWYVLLKEHSISRSTGSSYLAKASDNNKHIGVAGDGSPTCLQRIRL